MTSKTMTRYLLDEDRAQDLSAQAEHARAAAAEIRAMHAAGPDGETLELMTWVLEQIESDLLPRIERLLAEQEQKLRGPEPSKTERFYV